MLKFFTECVYESDGERIRKYEMSCGQESDRRLMVDLIVAELEVTLKKIHHHNSSECDQTVRFAVIFHLSKDLL